MCRSFVGEGEEVCSARNEVRSLQCEKRGTEFAVRETRYGVCSARNERQSLSELELRFKNCVERIPGFPSIILSPFVFHIHESGNRNEIVHKFERP